MADLSELYTKFVDSRNKYPQIRQAAEIALMGEIVERIKALEPVEYTPAEMLAKMNAVTTGGIKRGPGRPPKVEAPDAA